MMGMGIAARVNKVVAAPADTIYVETFGPPAVRPNFTPGLGPDFTWDAFEVHADTGLYLTFEDDATNTGNTAIRALTSQNADNTDVWVDAVVNAIATDGTKEVGVLCNRQAGTDDGYWARVTAPTATTATLQVQLGTAGSWSDIKAKGSIGTIPSAPFVLAMASDGAGNITVWIDNVVKWTGSSTVRTGLQGGIVCQSINEKIGTFRIGSGTYPGPA